MHCVELLREYVPAGQISHFVDLFLLEYVPALQDLHSLIDSSLYVPAGESKHEEEFLLLEVQAGHFKQSLELLNEYDPFQHL